MTTIEVRLPDIGDFADVPVVEVLVKPGDTVRPEDPLLALESDKATMEIPSPQGGVVRDVAVRVGDRVSQGAMLLTLEAPGGDGGPGAPPVVEPAHAPDHVALKPETVANATPHPAPEPAGHAVATAPGGGSNGAPPPLSAPPAAPQPAVPPAAPAVVAPAAAAHAADAPVPASYGAPGTPQPLAAAAPPPADAAAAPAHAQAHASPSVRRFARELGVALGEVRGTAPNGRATLEDVQTFVKSRLAEPPRAALAPPAETAPGGMPFGLPPVPSPDFAKLGPVERVALSRVRKLSGPYLHRNWLAIPHVTNHEDADVTDTEALRKRLNTEHPGAKVTMLAFVIVACVSALRAHPDVNSSLDGDELVRKGYYHVGFAADTPLGLVVPVLKDADRKGVLQIARESAELAAKARDGKLGPADMAGATFTISSLGGIGGTGFTPIVNAPEVAIMGVSRAAMKPVWNGAEFVPRLMLPLSLSYDHRVVDGALAARFNAHVAGVLADLRRAVL